MSARAHPRDSFSLSLSPLSPLWHTTIVFRPRTRARWASVEPAFFFLSYVFAVVEAPPLDSSVPMTSRNAEANTTNEQKT